MSGKRLQLKRGTTAQTSTFTGLNGEVTVDTTKKTLVVHDGSTIGGTVLAKASDVALKVDKVAGKQLSTEDYSTAEKNKLSGIAAGAQVNVPTDLSLGTATTTTIPLNSSTGSDVVLPSATTTAAGLLSGTDKIKLDSISANANNYTHPTSGVGAGTYRSVTVDTNGHVTGGTNPTTVSGYGLTDVYTKTESNTTMALKVNNSEKGTANGVATLDVNGKVVLTQIPDSVLGQLEYMGTGDFTTLPTATQKGQYWIASVSGNGYIVGDWAVWNGTAFDKVDNTDAIATVAGRTGNVVLTKSDVLLDNVDNTSDIAKPVSTAQQTALDLKANISSPTFTGPVTASTFNGSLNGNSSTATTLSGDQTNWNSIGRTNAVANMLSWKNYGNNHIIFDASAGTAPDGTNINNTNSTNSWDASHPALMGWNGIQTYGVRVDSARVADSATANVLKVASTDNSIPKFNGTTGEIQNSGVTIDDNNNLGLGVTPSAWTGTHKAIQFPGGGSLYNNGATNGYINLNSNNYYDGSNWRYINSTGASNYIQVNGNHYWSIASSGTAGSAITWANAMTLDASGKLSVMSDNSEFRIGYVNSTDRNLNIRSNPGYNSSLTFTETGISDRWTIGAMSGNGSMFFKTGSSLANGTTAMTLGSNGNLLIGTTTDNGVDKLQVNGSISASNVYKETVISVNVAAGQTVTQTFTLPDRHSSYIVKASMVGTNTDLYAFATYHNAYDFNITPIIASKSIGDYSLGSIDLQIKNNLSPYTYSEGNGKAGQCVVTNGDSVNRTLTIVIKKLI